MIAYVCWGGSHTTGWHSWPYFAALNLAEREEGAAIVDCAIFGGSTTTSARMLSNGLKAFHALDIDLSGCVGLEGDRPNALPVQVLQRVPRINGEGTYLNSDECDVLSGAEWTPPGPSLSRTSIPGDSASNRWLAKALNVSSCCRWEDDVAQRVLLFSAVLRTRAERLRLPLLQVLQPMARRDRSAPRLALLRTAWENDPIREPDFLAWRRYAGRPALTWGSIS